MGVVQSGAEPYPLLEQLCYHVIPNRPQRHVRTGGPKNPRPRPQMLRLTHNDTACPLVHQTEVPWEHIA